MSAYLFIRQNRLTNHARLIFNGKTDRKCWTWTGTAEGVKLCVKLAGEAGEKARVFQILEKGGIPASVWQLDDLINADSVKTKSMAGQISFRGYCFRRGIRPDGNGHEIQRLRERIKILQGLSIGEDGEEKASSKKLFNSLEYEKGQIFYEYNSEIWKKARCMPIPEELIRIQTTRQPKAYYILRAVCIQKFINLSRSAADSLSVKSILTKCPFADSAISHKRHVDSIEKTLNQCGFLVWDWRDGKKSMIEFAWDYPLKPAKNDEPTNETTA